VNRVLRAQGWRVVRIWEHALARRNEARLVPRLRRALACRGLTLKQNGLVAARAARQTPLRSVGMAAKNLKIHRTAKPQPKGLTTDVTDVTDGKEKQGI
jgi:hypothetical protein